MFAARRHRIEFVMMWFRAAITSYSLCRRRFLLGVLLRLSCRVCSRIDSKQIESHEYPPQFTVFVDGRDMHAMVCRNRASCWIDWLEFDGASQSRLGIPQTYDGGYILFKLNCILTHTLSGILLPARALP